MTKTADDTGPSARCEVCGASLTPAGRGRPPRYCSQACRARAYRQRTLGDPGDTPAHTRNPRTTTAIQASTVGRTAIAIADSDGLAAVSMRSVAAVLNVSVMSLYRHVSDRRDLNDLMVDLVYGDQPIAEPGGTDWTSDLELSARVEWAIYRAHPWVAHLVGSTTRPPNAPRLMAFTDWRMRALSDVGLEYTELVQVAIMLGTYLTSAGIPLAIEAEELRNSGLSRTEWLADRRKWFEQRTVSDRVPLPMVERFGDEAMSASDPDNIFEFGLQRILDGIAVFIDRARP